MTNYRVRLDNVPGVADQDFKNLTATEAIGVMVEYGVDQSFAETAITLDGDTFSFANGGVIEVTFDD